MCACQPGLALPVGRCAHTSLRVVPNLPGGLQMRWTDAHVPISRTEHRHFFKNRASAHTHTDVDGEESARVQPCNYRSNYHRRSAWLMIMLNVVTVASIYPARPGWADTKQMEGPAAEHLTLNTASSAVSAPQLIPEGACQHDHS